MAAVIEENSDGYAAFLKDMDMETEYYRQTKALMMKIKQINVEHVTYIYTVARVDQDTIMYVIGGEHPSSPVYTGPGVPEAIKKAERLAFDEQRATLGEDFEDTLYGFRLSAYEPIFHKDTNEFLGLVGADVTQIQLNSIMVIFIVQATASLIAGLIIFALAMWRLSGNVHLVINRHRYEAELARGIISSGRDYYAKMNEMYETLRVMRHDYRHHLRVIGELLHTGDTTEIEQYLADIQKRIPDNKFEQYCSNSVLNALLASYSERCVKSDILYDVRVSLPDDLAIPNYDMCIVLGNLLENAIEACGRQEGVRKIELAVNTRGAHLAVMVQNSFTGEIMPDGGRPASVKPDGGFGLRSVQAIAARYGGELMTEWGDGQFTAYVFMNL
ncbi:MAG: GHKL domain-containing protein [Desulfovibrionaceae bacterium]|nr:GHKL domain-containing protein [Desulfovibrionaceae bacterium]